MNSNFLGDNPLTDGSSDTPAVTGKINLSGSKAPKYVKEEEDEQEEDNENLTGLDHSEFNTYTDTKNKYDKYKRTRRNEIIPNSTWFDVRKHYIQGERTVSDSGCLVSENIPLKKLSELYHINYRTLLNRANAENWKKYRAAYLTRINDLNAGMDLDFHSQEAMTSEVAAMSTLSNLTVLIDTFIQSKYGDILTTVDDPTRILSEQDKETIASSTDVLELKQITDIVNNIYKTQQTIHSNSPVGQKLKEDQAAAKAGKTTSGMSNDAQNMTAKQRQAILNTIKAKLENISRQS